MWYAWRATRGTLDLGYYYSEREGITKEGSLWLYPKNDMGKIWIHDDGVLVKKVRGEG